MALALAPLLAIGSIAQGRYKVVSILGQGGMGAVYLVEDQRLFDKKLALKELLDILPDPAARAHALQQFQLEAKLLASLSHPNLPHISGYFTENGKQYLVMEYVDGQILEVILQKTPGFLPEAQVVDWAIQVCDALEYLHGQSPPIIFRDLKPANIMLDKNKRIKLIDFGIARFFRPGKTKDTQAMGTPGYAAPEQHGTGQTDARSDIYALGATLHYLLTKRDPATQPFSFPSCKTINSAVSAQMDALVGKATKQAPGDRYQSITEVKRLLQNMAGGSPQPAPTPAMVGKAGLIPIEWVQKPPRGMFRAYCRQCDKETMWSLNPNNTVCTCLEGDHTVAIYGGPHAPIDATLDARCSKCEQTCVWVVNQYGRTCLGCGSRRDAG